MQKEQEGAPADEEEDDERRKRSECVDVVPTGEPGGAAHRLDHAQALEERNRHREPCEGKPRERRQDVDPDEECHGQEDEDSHGERVCECP